QSQVLALLVVAVVAIAVLTSVARPLLFASLDPAVAAARGVPTRLLSIGFLLLLAVAAGEAAQITGALLVFALLVVPPTAAQALTAHPGRSIAISVLIGLFVVWVSLFVAYYAPYPI